MPSSRTGRSSTRASVTTRGISEDADIDQDIDLTRDEPESAQKYGDRSFDEIARIRARAAESRANIQEFMRSAVAYGVLLLFACVYLIILLSIQDELTIESLDKVTSMLVTPLVGIVGTVVGFYFAERRRRDR